MSAMTVCQECGMPCDPCEYHPFAACLMFKGCHNSDRVRANLQAVRDDAVRELGEEVAEQIHLAALSADRSQE